MSVDDPTATAIPVPDSLAERIRQHRELSRNYFEASKARWKELQERLIHELDVVVTTLDAWEVSYHDVEHRHRQLREELQQVDMHRDELENRSRELDQQQIDIENRHAEATQELEKQRAHLEAAEHGCRQELQDVICDLQQQIEEIQQTAESTEAKKQFLQEELERQNASRIRLEAEYRSARDALVVSRNDEKQLRQQLAQSKKILNERAQQVSVLRDQLEDSLHNANVEDGLAHGLVELQQQRDELQERLAEMESALQDQAEKSTEDDYEDIRRQFEMAVENIRSLQERNEELESKLASGPSQAIANCGFDWEAQKTQLLGQLDGNASLPPQNRLTVERAIETTDRIVQERDKEIAMLRSRLEMQHRDGATTPESAGEALDNDGIVQKERDRLRKLQEERREKLRAAEVQIAVERAENARLRAKLDEEMRDLERQARMLEKLEKGKSSGRRWMDHLGLSDDKG